MKRLPDMSAIDPKKPRGLGRGLSALFDDDEPQTMAVEATQAVAAATSDPALPRQSLPVAALQPGQFQPRIRFSTEAIRELAESIAVHGVLQPILVRPIAAGKFEIIAGERRWRAAQKAQLHEVPVVIRNLKDADALEIALVENLQRSDLNPIEEAVAFGKLMHDFGHSAEKLSAALGKSRSHIANTIRLLKLPKAVREMVIDERLSAGHARAIINAPNAEDLARQIITNGYSVRQVEKLVNAAAPQNAKPRTKSTGKAKNALPKDVDTLALEREMSVALGMKIGISMKTNTEGTIFIDFKSLDQLDDVLHRLSHNPGRLRDI
jgi:ParB family transcriptional regulator, chromosome partitioning protein